MVHFQALEKQEEVNPRAADGQKQQRAEQKSVKQTENSTELIDKELVIWKDCQDWPTQAKHTDRQIRN